MRGTKGVRALEHDRSLVTHGTLPRRALRPPPAPLPRNDEATDPSAGGTTMQSVHSRPWSRSLKPK